jgi:hypothetical protein
MKRLFYKRSPPFDFYTRATKEIELKSGLMLWPDTRIVIMHYLF